MSDTQYSQQARFDGGVNGVMAPHLLPDGEVASALNVDFSLEWGGLVCRRGISYFGKFATSLPGPTEYITRNYAFTTNTDQSLPSYAVVDQAPWYFVVSSSSGTNGKIFQANLTTNTFTMTAIGTGVVAARSHSVAYNQFIYLANGTLALRNDGTNTWNWILEQAPTPTVAVTTDASYTASQQFNPFNVVPLVASGGQCTASSTDSAGYVYGTFTNYPGSGLEPNTGDPILLATRSFTGTLTNTNWENPTVIGTKTYTIGSFGKDTIYLALTSGTFASFEVDLILGSDPSNYYAAQQSPTEMGLLAGGTALWTCTRTDFQLFGTITSTNAWTNIQSIQYRVHSELDPLGMPKEYELVIGPYIVKGNQLNCITDTNTGYAYYQTYAQCGTAGEILVEGNPSTESTPVIANQQALTLTFTTYTGTATSGITHRVIYRQGGAVGEAVQVASIPIGTLSFVDTYSDLEIATNLTLTTNLWASPWPTVNAVSDIFQDRVFLGSGTNLYWSLPGQPTAIQWDSETTISNQGDTIQGLVVWDKLLIINQNSIYELYGNVWEGAEQDWVLVKTGARRGSVAPKSICKTPYGVFLLGIDGCSMYTPGYGMDSPLEWVTEKLGDIWKGTETTDPATVKGARLRAINRSAIASSMAIYNDGKIYLAVPTGSSSVCDTIYVLDIAHKLAWMYDIGVAGTIGGIFWDYVQNRLLLGGASTVGGTSYLYQLEKGSYKKGLTLFDDGPTTWSATTKTWTIPSNLTLENVNLQAVGGSGGVEVLGVTNGTATATLGTLTSTSRAWTPLSLGTLSNIHSIAFTFNGTQSGSYQQGIYGLQWSAIEEPESLTRFQTPYVAFPSRTILKTWLSHINPSNNAVIGTLMVDGTAVQSATFTGSLPTIFETGEPNITEGKTAWTIYTSTGTFQHYNTRYEYEPKPFTKTTFVVTYKKIGGASQMDMPRFLNLDVEVPNSGTATITSTWDVDGITTATSTLTATGRKYFDSVAVPSGMRGFLFRQRMSSTVPFEVYRSSLDVNRIGVKGLTRVSLNGTPDQETNLT